MDKFLTYVAAYVLLQKGNEIFVMRRKNVYYMSGKWGLPSGHVEKDETIVDAALRELREEAGVEAKAQDLHFVHACYRRCPERTYNDYFFTCDNWQGEPRIMESEKCDGAKWIDREAEEDFVPELSNLLMMIPRRQFFSEVNWNQG